MERRRGLRVALFVLAQGGGYGGRKAGSLRQLRAGSPLYAVPFGFAQGPATVGMTAFGRRRGLRVALFVLAFQDYFGRWEIERIQG